MMKISSHIANSTNKLSDIIESIENEFKRAKKLAADKLGADEVDVFFIYAPEQTIPELGVGGYTPGPHNVYISFDPEHDIKSEDIYASLLHEFHHAVRWRDPGYGKTLGEVMFSEGLASLFEEEETGVRPIYTSVKLDAKIIAKAKKELDSESYDHDQWLFGYAQKIPRWFGYSYGYQLAQKASKQTGLNAAEMVHSKWDMVFAEAIS